jgi:hypothetical protein
MTVQGRALGVRLAASGQGRMCAGFAEDVPILRRWREMGLDWIERRRPHWINGKRS